MEPSTFKDEIKKKKVLILGLARTGMSVARHLNALGAIVVVNDYATLDTNPDAQALVEENIRVVSGGHPIALLDEDFSFVVKNPGIPYTNPIVERALTLEIPVITDIECSYLLTEAPIIGITGSNGKTTTTQLTYDILHLADQENGKTYLGGNIGIPSLDIALPACEADRLVLELSSFQLMGTVMFRPHIAVITNIYPAHIDYHGSIEAYKAAKWRITQNQTSQDYLILNHDQKQFNIEETQAQIIWFSTKEKVKGAWFDSNQKNFMWNEEVIAKQSEFPLPGDHNLANALVAIAIAKLEGISNETIQSALMHYHGVEHRLQFVKTVNQRKFFNDSKATNVDATITALDSFDTPVIWLAGGLDRGLSVDELASHLDYVKGIVTFGESQDKIKALAKQEDIPVYGVGESMAESVEMAYQNSSSGDTILLSPAHASWDQYDNFEQRGDCFVSAIEGLE